MASPSKVVVPKAKVPKKEPEHPQYVVMVKDAIVSLKERTGSSSVAIKKFVESKYQGLPSNFSVHLSNALKKLTANGKLVKVKASYKLGEELKKTPKPTKMPSKVVKKPTKKTKVAAKPKAVAKPKAEKTKKAPKAVSASKEPKAAAKPKAEKPKAKK